MCTKRIIPCLDVKDGKVVKGINFVGFKEIGDPAEYALAYEKQGADEIVLLDITATHEGRGTMIDLVRRTAENISIPITVGGGIRTVEDFLPLLNAGADKVSVNSAAVKNPEIISGAADRFGSQFVVLAIDGIKTGPDKYNVVINGGRKDTGLDVVEWAKKGVDLGAGEILLTSMDADGTKDGFDIGMLTAVCDAVNVPVIASGGCGSIDDFVEVFLETKVDAALAASVFHYGEITVSQVKEALQITGIPVNIKDLQETKEINISENLEVFFVKSELIPVIVQDENTEEVLMLAYMNKESLAKTLETGYTWFYSRSRGELWNKGATSGHIQQVVSITSDCDDDTLLIRAIQTGQACHTGNKTCFYQPPIYKNEEIITGKDVNSKE